LENNTTKKKEKINDIQVSVLYFFPIMFLLIGLVYGLFVEGFQNLISGFVRILFSPTILITDFIEIGGIGATFINVGAIAVFNLALIRYYKLRVSGVVLAAFFTVIGFSFFGKNLLNIIPIYLGGFLYAKHQKISPKGILIVIMFGTALSPIVSELSFTGIMPQFLSLAVGFLAGIFIGFVLVPLSSHFLKFHSGFNLYNIGFASGIIGTVLTSILRSLKIEVAPVNIIYQQSQDILLVFLIVTFIYLMILGLYINEKPLRQYFQIFKYGGRLVTDFTHLIGSGFSLINMSILGLFGIIYVIAVKGTINGPVIAGILTVAGFGAFGKHLKNCIPIMVGVLAGALLFGYNLSSTGVIISVLFSTTLAPVAGTYGPIIGFVAGVLHMTLVTNVGIIHGGINLYNNGFAGGLVAGFFVPIVDAFKKR